MSASDRPKFTDQQLKQYFDYIELPEIARHQLISVNPSDQLESLSILIRHQLCHVPFENLDLHYAPVKGVSLNIFHLFNKVVERKAGRGGYCMQNNSLFGTVLRSLGFDIVSAGARVATDFGSPSAGQQEPDEVSYGGFTHQVNFVTIGGKKYFVDVGFGSQGPTFPIPLEEEFTAIQTGTKDNVAATLQLTRGFTGNHTSRDPLQKVWRYNIKYGPESDESKNWLPVYCFTEMEFMPHDFEISSGYVSTSRSSIFVNQIIFQKYIASDDGQSLIGDRTLVNDVIKEKKLGKSEVLRECKSEEERLSGMEEFLGVRLSLGEAKGIKGHHTEIK